MKIMIAHWKIYLGCFVLSFAALSGEEEKEKEFQVVGEVPAGWKVVASSDGPLIEKWVELKSGEKKRLLLRSYMLKPNDDKAFKNAAVDHLTMSSGQKMDSVLISQNENLGQTGDELALMLQHLKSLLASLPKTTTESKEL